MPVARVQESKGCSVGVLRTDCDDGHKNVELDMPPSGDDQNRQKNVLDAFGAHVASRSVVPARGVAIASGSGAVA